MHLFFVNCYKTSEEMSRTKNLEEVQKIGTHRTIIPKATLHSPHIPKITDSISKESTIAKECRLCTEGNPL